MKYIKSTIEEQQICNNYIYKNRSNSEKINYHNKVFEKPWGKEYMIYQNDYIGIWILHINENCETSLHCHFNKDTLLIPMTHPFRINLYERYEICNKMESMYIPKNTFHGIHSYVHNSIIMEIEIYHHTINYSDKNDLLRIKDIYNRDKNRYETSVIEREPIDEITELLEEQYYHLYNKVELRISSEYCRNSNHNILLDGRIYINRNNVTSGSLIVCNNSEMSILENCKFLQISDINSKYNHKIIYNKQHLNDTNIDRNKKIGLTCGCFDILHEGHITNLKKCKQYCDILYLCLSSDEQIRRIKGEKRPINNINDRLNMLIHFDFIDKIILYDEINDENEIELDNIMNIVQPDIWFKGKDYNEQQIRKKHPSLKDIVLIDLIENKSTTNIVKKILS